MTGGSVDAIMVEKWSVGYSAAQGVTVLRLEFARRPPMTFAFPPDQAEAVGKAMQQRPLILTQ